MVGKRTMTMLMAMLVDMVTHHTAMGMATLKSTEPARIMVISTALECNNADII